jgi:shikimate kinase
VFNNGSRAILSTDRAEALAIPLGLTIRPGHGRNLYLSGFMGCGKSTVGFLLAQRLKWNFVDLDRLVELRSGMRLPLLFEKAGERYFRELESGLLNEVALSPNQVISLGGGTLLKEDNRTQISETGLQIYLRATFPTLAERIAQAPGSRPLLNAIADESLSVRIRVLMRARKPFYEMADWIVDTDGQSPYETVQEILALYQMISTSSPA